MEGGGCWEEAAWELAALAMTLVVAGIALVGVKEERLVAIFCAARRAVIAVSYRAGEQVSRPHKDRIELDKPYHPVL